MNTASIMRILGKVKEGAGAFHCWGRKKQADILDFVKQSETWEMNVTICSFKREKRNLESSRLPGESSGSFFVGQSWERREIKRTDFLTPILPLYGGRMGSFGTNTPYIF